MNYQYLSINQDDSFLILTINRQEALNALNKRIMEELSHFFSEDLPARKDAKGVIITGAGEKSFVAGADIKEFLGLDAEGGRRLSQTGQEVFFLIERCTRPVIAAVNGFALGGGCELAMACHLRIATGNARFGQPEVNLGIIPGYGGTQRLIQYIGKGKAMELLLTGDMIDAQEAHRLGLVNHVVEPEELIPTAKKMLKKISSKGPVAIAKVIECVNAYFQHNMDGFVKEVQDFGFTTGTDDFREGASAFVEKRKANFSGE
jgi:enoyl-CoA hydratase